MKIWNLVNYQNWLPAKRVQIQNKAAGWRASRAFLALLLVFGRCPALVHSPQSVCPSWVCIACLPSSSLTSEHICLLEWSAFKHSLGFEASWKSKRDVSHDLAFREGIYSISFVRISPVVLSHRSPWQRCLNPCGIECQPYNDSFPQRVAHSRVGLVWHKLYGPLILMCAVAWPWHFDSNCFQGFAYLR